MHKQKLKPAPSRLLAPNQRSRKFFIKRFRWIGLTLVTIIFSLVAETFSVPPSSTSALVASAATSTRSDWVRAVSEQGKRQNQHSFATSTRSDWVKAVSEQGRQKLHPFNDIASSSYPSAVNLNQH